MIEDIEAQNFNLTETVNSKTLSPTKTHKDVINDKMNKF